MEDTRKIWMLRIGDHLKGPYETKTVKSLILTHKISEIDELALPCKSWSYVRDRKEFAESLQQLRSASFTRMSKDSESYTGTEKLADLTQGDQTLELTSADSVDIKTEPLSGFDSLGLEHPKLDLDKLRLDQRSQQPAQKSGYRFVLWLIVIAAVFSGGYFYSSSQLEFNPLVFLKQLNSDYSSKFNMSWDAGDYAKALQNLKAQKSLKNKHSLKYAVLLLLSNNDFNSADVALEAASNKTTAGWKNAKGLIEFKSGRFDSAESYFLSALEQNPAYVPALVNLGLLKRVDQDWSGARFYFESAYSSSSSELGQEEISFYLVEAWLKQVMQKDGLAQIEEVRAFLKNRLSSSSTFSHELQLLDIWINIQKGRWTESKNEILKRFVSLDPFILIERKRSPFFHKLDKGEFSYMCEEFGKVFASAPLGKASHALCLAMNKQHVQALYLLEGSTNEHELALSSFLHGLIGDEIKSEEALTLAMEVSANDSVVKLFLQARFCFDKGDMKCSAKYWKKALDLNQEAYTAHTGIARAYFEVKDLLKARTFLDRAKVFTSTYGPMIELQHLMNQKNK